MLRSSSKAAGGALVALALLLGSASAQTLIPPSGAGGGPPNGAAGGDLSGTYPNPTVVAAAGNLTVGGNATVNGLLSAGVAGSAVGQLRFFNATSGLVRLQPPTGALGNVTLTLPAVSSTVATVANTLGDFATTTSTQLAGVISDETGTGSLVFGTSPTFGGTVTLPDSATWSASGLVDTATYVTVAGPVFNLSPTVNYSQTAGTPSFVLFDPIISPAGASATNLIGVQCSPTVASSSDSLTTVRACDFGLTIAASYTGGVTTANTIRVNGLINSSANPAVNNNSMQITGSTNGNGVAVGTVNNTGVNVTLSTAGAGSGGTVVNSGIIITGAGGTGAGTTTNFAINDTSTAPALITGHYVTAGPTPTCGSGCASLAGNDNAFVVTTGAAQTSITVNFGGTGATAWTTNPVCNVSSNSTASATDIASVSTSAITFGASVALSGALLYVNCRQ